MTHIRLSGPRKPKVRQSSNHHRSLLGTTSIRPAPQAPAFIRNRQGALEKSNVSGVEELTAMLDVQRAYERISNMVKTATTSVPGRSSASAPSTPDPERPHMKALTTAATGSEGPGDQRLGHLQQHRQHAHHRLQEPARQLPGSALPDPAPPGLHHFGRRNAGAGRRAARLGRPASSPRRAT